MECMVSDWCRIGFLDAGRLCHGGGRFYPCQKHRQHHYEEPDGLLHWHGGVAVESSLLPKVQADIVVSKVPVRTVIETAKKVLYTGHIGDGKIFIYDVENVVKVRTGEEGYDALQDVE